MNTKFILSIEGQNCGTPIVLFIRVPGRPWTEQIVLPEACAVSSSRPVPVTGRL